MPRRRGTAPATARALLWTGPSSTVPRRVPLNGSSSATSGGRAWGKLEFLGGFGLSLGELPRPLALGVQFRSEQDRDVGDPDPDEQRNNPTQGPVSLVIGAEIRHVEREQCR